MSSGTLLSIDGSLEDTTFIPDPKYSYNFKGEVYKSPSPLEDVGTTPILDSDKCWNIFLCSMRFNISILLSNPSDFDLSPYYFFELLSAPIKTTEISLYFVCFMSEIASIRPSKPFHLEKLPAYKTSYL